MDKNENKKDSSKRSKSKKVAVIATSVALGVSAISLGVGLGLGLKETNHNFNITINSSLEGFKDYDITSQKELTIAQLKEMFEPQIGYKVVGVYKDQAMLEEYADTDIIKASTNVYIKYEMKKFSIVIYEEDKSSIKQTVTVNYNQPLNVEATKEQDREFTYEFARWLDYYTDEEVNVEQITSDKAIYPEFRSIQREYTLSIPEGVNVIRNEKPLTNQDKVHYGEELIVSYVLPEHNHLATFKVNGNEFVNGGTFIVNGNVEIEFEYEIDQVDVSFYDGEDLIEVVKVDYGNAVQPVSLAEKPGDKHFEKYIFEKWTLKNGEETNFDQITANKSFYAKWKGEGYKFDYFNFVQLSDGTYSVAGLKDKTKTEIVIPDIYKDGTKVTSVANYAFHYNNKIVSATLSDNLTNVGISAFAYCAKLKTNNSNGVKYLGSETNPYMCAIASTNDSSRTIEIENSCKIINQLGNIKVNSIPEGLISYSSFDEKEISLDILPDDLMFVGPRTSFISINNEYNISKGVKYIGSATNKYMYLCGVEDNTLTTYEIEESCKFIGPSAFKNCSNLTTLNIPGNVVTIGEYSFKGCNNLQNIDIPEGLECLYDVPSNQTSLILPDGITVIESNILCGKNLTSIILPDTLNLLIFDYRNTRFGNRIEYNISKGLKYLGSASNKYMFLCGVEDKTLTSYEIEESCKFIGNRAFENCINLKAIEIPENVIMMDSVFSGCSNLESIIFLGDNLVGTNISSISSLTTLILPENTMSCIVEPRSLPNLEYNISKGLKYIGSSTNKYMYLCGVEDKTLTSYEIEESCKVIAGGAFSNCSNMTSIEIPENIKRIENSFGDCNSLTSLTLSENIAFFVYIGVPTEVVIEGECCFNTSFGFSSTKVFKVRKEIIDDDSNYNSDLMRGSFTKTLEGDYYVFTRTY